MAPPADRPPPPTPPPLPAPGGTTPRPADGVVRRTADHLRDRWAADRPAFGVWSSSPDPSVAELLAATDFDYVCVDLQHGIATYSELPGIVTAMRAADRA